MFTAYFIGMGHTLDHCIGLERANEIMKELISEKLKRKAGKSETSIISNEIGTELEFAYDGLSIKWESESNWLPPTMSLI